MVQVCKLYSSCEWRRSTMSSQHMSREHTWMEAPSSGTASKSMKPSVWSATCPKAAFSRADSRVDFTLPLLSYIRSLRSNAEPEVELRSTLRTTKGYACRLVLACDEQACQCSGRHVGSLLDGYCWGMSEGTMQLTSRSSYASISWHSLQQQAGKAADTTWDCRE